jgi:tetratricopeptide (TPR) repeat protein
MPKALHSNRVQPRAIIAEWLAVGLFCIGLILALGWSQCARASYWKDIPDEDFKYLPEYCKLAVRRYGDQGTRWGMATPEQLAPLFAFEKRVGCAGDLHHYCAGLWQLVTAERPNPWLPREHLLASAVGEFEYTLKGCERPDAPLKPEILTYQGRAYIGLAHYQNAVKVLTEAIQRNPKYVDAYTELSAVFLKVNSPEDARRALEDGLKQVPDSRVLKLRLQRLSDKAGTDKAAGEKPKTEKAMAPKGP